MKEVVLLFAGVVFIIISLSFVIAVIRGLSGRKTENRNTYIVIISFTFFFSGMYASNPSLPELEEAVSKDYSVSLTAIGFGDESFTKALMGESEYVIHNLGWINISEVYVGDKKLVYIGAFHKYHRLP
ncbi:hypothetical protein [Paenibacillus agaridevorans]|uniref:hypothetical protein n=1 Tax=Paenibacillus agaridevorans TaxID=171404 RepID=UPI001BE42DD0|nr:hypothetical protein [Paenibacillus agaridevorans]